MENTKKNNSILPVILYVLAALFMLYGVYMIYSSIVYVQDYSSFGNVTATNIIQYVVSSCASYIGFGVLFFVSAKILTQLTQCPQAVEENALCEEPTSKIIDPCDDTADEDSEIILEDDVIDDNIEEEPADVVEESESETTTAETDDKISSAMIKNIFENK